MSDETLLEWFERSQANGMRHTRAVRSKRWERWYFRAFRHNPESLVSRRLDALALDEIEHRRWLRENPPPNSAHSGEVVSASGGAESS